MYASIARVFHRIRLVAACGLLALSAVVSQAATITVNVKAQPSGTLTSFNIKNNGSLLTTVNTSTTLSQPCGSANPGDVFTVFWLNGATEIPAVSEVDGGNTSTVVGFSNQTFPAAGQYFKGGTGATPTYRLDFSLKNNTFSTHSYTAVRTDTMASIIGGTQTLTPGGNLNVTYTNVTALYPVTVSSVDGILPVFLGSIPASPGTYWHLEDGSTPTPGQLTHGYDAAPTPGTNTVDYSAYFGGTNPPVSANLTEGTFKAGATESLNSMRDVVSGQASGFNGLSNLLAGSYGASTNQLTQLTNIEGLLGSIKTNTTGLTNSMAQKVAGASEVSTNPADYSSQAASQIGSVSNSIVGLQGTIGALTNGYSDDHLDDYWKINVPHYGLADFNPMSLGWMGTLATWIRALIGWMAYAGLVAFMVRDFKDAAFRVQTFQQGRAPVIGGSVLGTGFQSSLFMHLPIFFVIAGVMIAFLAGLITFFNTTGAVAALANPPLSGTSKPRAIAEGLWLLNQFVPVALLIVHFVTGALWHLALALGAFGTGMTIRAMPSCILVGLMVANTYGDVQMTLVNGTAAMATMQLNAGDTYYIPPGASLSIAPFNDFFVIGSTNGTTYSFLTTAGAPFITGRDSLATGYICVNCGSGGNPGVRWVTDENEWYAFSRGLGLGGIVLSLQGVRWILGVVGRAPATGALE
jgi:hypothetical protein